MPKSPLTIIPFEKLKNTLAWKLTSELVRKRAKGKCYTCGRRVEFKKMVAGHSREKRGASGTYFELDGLRGQCNYCNRRQHGNYSVFTLKLIEEIGFERVKELAKKAQKSKKWTRGELDKIAEERRQLLKALE